VQSAFFLTRPHRTCPLRAPSHGHDSTDSACAGCVGGSSCDCSACCFEACAEMKASYEPLISGECWPIYWQHSLTYDLLPATGVHRSSACLRLASLVANATSLKLQIQGLRSGSVTGTTFQSRIWPYPASSDCAVDLYKLLAAASSAPPLASSPLAAAALIDHQLR
jgi:hypothetical protein